MSDQGELPMGDQSKSRHNSEGPLPDFTLDELRHRMKVLDVKRLLIKELAPNDNSKNQPYLSGSMDVANILPSGTAYVDVTPKGYESTSSTRMAPTRRRKRSGSRCETNPLSTVPGSAFFRLSQSCSQRAISSPHDTNARTNSVFRDNQRSQDHWLVCRTGQQDCP